MAMRWCAMSYEVIEIGKRSFERLDMNARCMRGRDYFAREFDSVCQGLIYNTIKREYCVWNLG
jgi:hypothetical protein